MREDWRIYWGEMRKHALRAFIYWPIFTITLFAVISHVGSDGKQFFSETLAVSAVFNYAIGGSIFLAYGIFYAILTHLKKSKPHSLQIDRYLSVHIGVTLLGLTIGLFGADRITSVMLRQDPMSGRQWVQSAFLGMVLGLLFIFFYAYTKTKAAMVHLEKVTTESQYQTLKDQMQPHFLFNALNGLSELIHQNPLEAAAMVTKLADLYRHILENSQHKTSGLRSELAIVDDYLALQHLRFGDKLTFRIESAVGSADPQVPSLMIQTLVENAIKHGIANSIDGGEIVISAGQAADQWYFLSVKNSGAAAKNFVSRGTGLANTRKRLELLYGTRHRFSIGANEQGQTEVKFFFSGEHFV